MTCRIEYLIIIINNTYNCNSELRLTIIVNGINLFYFIFDIVQVFIFAAKYSKPTLTQDVKELLQSSLIIYQVIIFTAKYPKKNFKPRCQRVGTQSLKYLSSSHINYQIPKTTSSQGVKGLLQSPLNIYQVVTFITKYPKTTSSNDVKGLLQRPLNIYQVVTFITKYPKTSNDVKGLVHWQ